ncbi:hypothetical protein FisN_9Lh095 [Fistulifera solaris]|uniref:Uncharacterized protein n=1 Tax=Fistulifera solaris TaxID=1519565 RepID=A0A1Z5KLL5_FISSO|nr:hypothetical protein FisN_9Lh095 [Fistulifera solaris]|eukprot:GAX26828.1 hypothetical protein FisN_9Lh095 [Fistulifera solaris]
MSFGGNKKSKDELGSSKGWKIDFSATIQTQSTSSSQSSQPEPPATRLSTAAEDIPAETRIPSSPENSASVPAPPPGFTLWENPDLYLESLQDTPKQQQSAAASMPPPPPPVQTVAVRPAQAAASWGTALAHSVTGQSSSNEAFDSFLSSLSSQFNPPVHSVPASCATSVTTFQSSYEGASRVMPPPPPPQPPTQPVYLPTRPLFPYKTVEVPKAALHALYGKEPRRRTIAATDFVTWHDGGPPHALQWTSCFVCPLTGELFLTRPFGANLDFSDQQGLIWYKKKTSAEHGAAACAYDCLTYRDFRSINPAVPPFKLLLAEGEVAYEQARMSLPVSVPSHVQTTVEELRAAAAHRRTAPSGEAAWNAHPGDSDLPNYFHNI